MFTMVQRQMEVLVSYFSLDHCVFLPLSNQAQDCHVLSRDSWATRLMLTVPPCLGTLPPQGEIEQKRGCGQT